MAPSVYGIRSEALIQVFIYSSRYPSFSFLASSPSGCYRKWSDLHSSDVPWTRVIFFLESYLLKSYPSFKNQLKSGLYRSIISPESTEAFVLSTLKFNFSFLWAPMQRTPPPTQMNFLLINLHLSVCFPGTEVSYHLWRRLIISP